MRFWKSQNGPAFDEMDRNAIKSVKDEMITTLLYIFNNSIWCPVKLKIAKVIQIRGAGSYDKLHTYISETMLFKYSRENHA